MKGKSDPTVLALCLGVAACAGPALADPPSFGGMNLGGAENGFAECTVVAKLVYERFFSYEMTLGLRCDRPQLLNRIRKVTYVCFPSRNHTMRMSIEDYCNDLDCEQYLRLRPTCTKFWGEDYSLAEAALARGVPAFEVTERGTVERDGAFSFKSITNGGRELGVLVEITDVDGRRHKLLTGQQLDVTGATLRGPSLALAVEVGYHKARLPLKKSISQPFTLGKRPVQVCSANFRFVPSTEPSPKSIQDLFAEDVERVEVISKSPFRFTVIRDPQELSKASFEVPVDEDVKNSTAHLHHHWFVAVVFRDGSCQTFNPDIAHNAYEYDGSMRVGWVEEPCAFGRADMVILDIPNLMDFREAGGQ